MRMHATIDRFLSAIPGIRAWLLPRYAHEPCNVESLLALLDDARPFETE